VRDARLYLRGLTILSDSLDRAPFWNDDYQDGKEAREVGSRPPVGTKLLLLGQSSRFFPMGLVLSRQEDGTYRRIGIFGEWPTYPEAGYWNTKRATIETVVVV
jgi:hypothetical protein